MRPVPSPHLCGEGPRRGMRSLWLNATALASQVRLFQSALMFNIGSEHGVHARLKTFAPGFEIVINIGVNAKTDGGFWRKIKDHRI